MGTDIIFSMEKRDPHTNEWQIHKDWYRDNHQPPPTEEDWEDEEYYYEPYDAVQPKDFTFDRDYDAFAMLANVRNGYGFANTDTGQGFKPIADVRGIPDDASEIFRLIVECFGEVYCTSYLTLQELRNLEPQGYWDRTTRKSAIITLNYYMKMHENKKIGMDPQHSVIFRKNPQNVLISMAEASDYAIQKEENTLDPKKRYYVKYHWNVTYRKSGKQILKLIEYLEDFARKQRISPENLRILFFFHD